MSGHRRPEAALSYQTLNAAQIVDTIRRLEQRIAERFPGAGLVRVCHDLLVIAEETQRKAELIARPNMLLRSLVVVAILGGLAALGSVVLTLTHMIHPQVGNEVSGLLVGIDAALNITVLAAGALFSPFRSKTGSSAGGRCATCTVSAPSPTSSTCTS